MALFITSHASKRMKQRGINELVIKIVLSFDRKVYVKGAVYYIIGKKEIKKFMDKEPLIKDLNGIHVVTASDDDSYRILTVFKNKHLVK